MRKSSVFLVLPVLLILSLGAQEQPELVPPKKPTLVQPAPEPIAGVPVTLEEKPTPMSEAPIVSEEKEVVKIPSLEKGINMEPNIGLTKDTHTASIDLLKKLQADEYVLYTKTLKFHWNVTGMNFNDLHLFWNKQYEQLLGFVDDVAERIRALGGNAPGTQTEFLKLTRLKEEPGVVPDAKEMIKKLLDDHEVLIRAIRADIDATAKSNEMGTNNFLCDLITKHEKMAWMLRAYLEA